MLTEKDLENTIFRLCAVESKKMIGIGFNVENETKIYTCEKISDKRFLLCFITQQNEYINKKPEITKELQIIICGQVIPYNGIITKERLGRIVNSLFCLELEK